MTGIGRLTVQWGITLVLATTLSFASLGFTIFTSPLKQRESHLLVLCDTPPTEYALPKMAHPSALPLSHPRL